MTDPKKIVKMLTEPQKRWMLGLGAGSKCARRLQELGLIQRYGVVWWEKTDLGLAVTRILEAAA